MFSDSFRFCFLYAALLDESDSAQLEAVYKTPISP